MVLVLLSVVKQRLDAVRLVLAGALVTEVAVRVGVSRQTLHSWLNRYLAQGVAGLVDRSRRPKSCPHRCSSDVEVVVVEMRRKHPRWGAKRIRMQLLKAGGAGRAHHQPAVLGGWHAGRYRVLGADGWRRRATNGRAVRGAGMGTDHDDTGRSPGGELLAELTKAGKLHPATPSGLPPRPSGSIVDHDAGQELREMRDAERY